MNSKDVKAALERMCITTAHVDTDTEALALLEQIERDQATLRAYLRTFDQREAVVEAAIAYMSGDETPCFEDLQHAVAAYLEAQKGEG